jgi:N-methylhydantoinase A
MIYRIGVDVGGTFTDLIAASGDGAVVEAKVPSRRERPEEALEAGLEELAARTGENSVGSLLRNTRMITQGTTVAINALLQRTGAKTGLLCTRGFRDALEIRLGYKEERYIFPYGPPTSLVARRWRIPVTERVDSTGAVRIPLNEHEVLEAARFFQDEGVDAVAICFLWSFLHPDHELRAADIVRQHLPDVFVSASVDVLPKIREYNRTSTTVLNAYVGPICARYVMRTERLLAQLGYEGRVRYVQSNGGLAESAEVVQRPVLLLVSGPAAAPAAGLRFARLAGRDFISVDMGGTSFDTCLVRDGLPDMRSFADISRHRVATPLIDVHTIGAGGGSVGTVEEGLLRVGPESAEAYPGPACYQRGGNRATVTDANVVLGRLNQEALLGGEFPISACLARAAVEKDVADPLSVDADVGAAGVIEVVSRNMAEAIREITVRRGYDPRDYVLLVGGGAGGLHAAELASVLGIPKVLIPRVASAFCAFGAVVADLRHDYSASHVADTYALNQQALAELFEQLEARGKRTLREEGVHESNMSFLRSIEMRYKEQVYECTIDVSELDLRGMADEVQRSIEGSFHDRHRDLYDYSQPEYPCEVIAVTLTALGRSAELVVAPDVESLALEAAHVEPVAFRSVRFNREEPPITTPIYDATHIRSDYSVDGPAIIEERNTTIAVPPGWLLELYSRDSAYVLTPT